LASIFRSVASASNLVADGLSGSTDHMADAELVAAAQPLLDQMYARQLADFRARYDARLNEGRATSDLSRAAWAVSHGAIDALLVDIDSVVPGILDEATRRITLAANEDADSYGVCDAIAMRALATGAAVLGVRPPDPLNHLSTAAL
jgi:hypothetical protein